jgi:hypothetical protein
MLRVIDDTWAEVQTASGARGFLARRLITEAGDTPARTVGAGTSLQATVNGTLVVYRDVPIDTWYAPYVSLLIEEKIAEGYRDSHGNPTGEFGVANSVTRAEVLKMALEAAGKADALSDLAPENKTARGTWASSYVRRAEDLGLSVFMTNPDVNAPATRGEVVQIVLDVLGYPVGKTPAAFADVPADHPYSHAIALAVFYGFVEGYADGTFGPDKTINRAEVSKIIALAREVAGK